MSLPQITPPGGTPVFLAAGHGAEVGSPYANLELGRGYTRQRRLWTVRPPRVVSVAWFLSSEQMERVDRWFEDVLRAGERSFAALVANQGPGQRWWAAQWRAPYEAEPISKGRWRVTGQLLLTGEPSIDPPSNSNLSLQISASLTGSAFVSVSKDMALEVTVDLE